MPSWEEKLCTSTLAPGMGKFLSLSQKLYGSFGIGFEPAPTAVCNAWRIYPEVEMHHGDGVEKLACLRSGGVDLITSVGVIEYFPDLEYMCKMMHHSLRVLKPGGMISHAWIMYSPKKGDKGDDKLNIHPDFWGLKWDSVGSDMSWNQKWTKNEAASALQTRALPACAPSIGAQVDLQSVLIFVNSLGPTNG